MTKQEFLAMSLPFGIYVDDDKNTCELQCRKLIGIHDDYVYIDYNCVGYQEQLIDVCKPVCRPLSDLTKDIEHKGEKFVPYKKLGWELYHNDCGMGELLSFADCHSGTVNVLDYMGTLQKLLQWHFDIADLISKGEAIDVNTLETNPYK